MQFRTVDCQKLVQCFFLNGPATVEEAAKAVGLSKGLAELILTQRKDTWARHHNYEETGDVVSITPKPLWFSWAWKHAHETGVYDVPKIEAKYPEIASEAAARFGKGTATSGRATDSLMPAVLDIAVTCPGCDKNLRATIPSIVAAKTLRCSSCQRQFIPRSLSGYVYVLSHPKMPGLVKIGETAAQGAQRAKEDVEKRVNELGRPTGVPGPFVIEAIFASGAHEEHESEIHRRVQKAAKRIEGTEFFEVERDEAVRIAEEVVGTGPINPHDRSLSLMPQRL